MYMVIDYTKEEHQHLADLCFGIVMQSCVATGTDTPEYYRSMAKAEAEAEVEEREAIRSGLYCPSPPSAEDIDDSWSFEEMADAVECGLQSGETL